MEAWQQFDCYKALGVHLTATPVEIRKAYYRASREAHPDRGGSHEGQVRINLAYEVLSDPVTRQAHDLFWYRFRAPGAAAPEPRPEPPRARREPPAPRPAAPSTPAGPAPPNPEDPLGALWNRVREALGYGAAGPPPQAAGPAEGLAMATAGAAQTSAGQRNGGVHRLTFADASALSGLALSASLSDLALGGALPFLHTLWLVAGAAWAVFAVMSLRRPRLAARGVAAGGEARGPAQRVEHARREAARAERDPRVARYARGVAFLTGLLMRPTELDDSEDQLARRITAALFVMGYKPLGYDRRYRLLLFTDDEERLLIRFRHRSGAAINVTFVQGVVDAMQYTGSTKGILFCSTGLSGNGAVLAAQHGVKWYTLTRMNEWIDSVIRGRYVGPPGDILVLLEHVVTFVSQLSTPLPTQRAARRGRVA